MDYEERQKNIETLFQMARYLDQSGSTDQAEKLYLEAIKQAEKYLGRNSAQTGKIILECIDFYDRIGREEDSELMQKRLGSIASYVLSKLASTSALSD